MGGQRRFRVSVKVPRDVYPDRPRYEAALDKTEAIGPQPHPRDFCPLPPLKKQPEDLLVACLGACLVSNQRLWVDVHIPTHRYDGRLPPNEIGELHKAKAARVIDPNGGVTGYILVHPAYDRWGASFGLVTSPKHLCWGSMTASFIRVGKAGAPDTEHSLVRASGSAVGKRIDFPDLAGALPLLTPTVVAEGALPRGQRWDLFTPQTAWQVGPPDDPVDGERCAYYVGAKGDKWDVFPFGGLKIIKCKSLGYWDDFRNYDDAKRRLEELATK